MSPFKLLPFLIIIMIFMPIKLGETGGLKKEPENLVFYLKSIGQLISDIKEQNIGVSFNDVIAASVKKPKSLLVKVADKPSSPSDQRLIMLETIKDLQKMEDFLTGKESMIRRLENYCEGLVEKHIFEKDPKTVMDIEDVLEYIKDLNNGDQINKINLKNNVNGVIEVLNRKARHMPEIEKLVDYLEVRRNAIAGVIAMDMYMEKEGFTIADMFELHGLIQKFAPFIDRLMDHAGAVKSMNLAYSSVVGKDFVENAEEAKKMSFIMKLELLSSKEKVQRDSTKWSKMVEELKQLANM